MKTIVTIIPRNLVANLPLSLFCPFVETKKQIKSNFKQVGDLVTRNIAVFCL